MLFLLLLLSILSVRADDCVSCVTGGGLWCGDVGSSVGCAAVQDNCIAVVNDTYNCPRYPDPAYAYDDAWARKWILPLIGGVIAYNNTEACLKTNLPSTTLYRNINVECKHPGSYCHCFTAYDTLAKVIMVSCRGAHGKMQYFDVKSSIYLKKKAFFNCGNINSYFYNAFYYMWNGGLEQSLRELKYMYPDYTLIATGHSLGAAIVTLFTAQVVKINMWQPQNIKMINLGSPRVGDETFAKWYDSTFPYSYRVVHAADPIPHWPAMKGKDELFHHRYEIWYNNDMAVGSNYTICGEADGPYCSNYNPPADGGDDHMLYYNKNFHTWPYQGCPK